MFSVRAFFLITLLTVLPITSAAQDAKTVVNRAELAMQTVSVKTLQYSGFSANLEKQQISPITSYTRRLDYSAAVGTPWPEQIEFWIRAVDKVLQDKDFKKDLALNFWVPRPIRYPDTVKWMQDDYDENRAVLKELGML